MAHPSLGPCPKISLVPGSGRASSLLGRMEERNLNQSMLPFCKGNGNAAYNFQLHTWPERLHAFRFQTPHFLLPQSSGEVDRTPNALAMWPTCSLPLLSSSSALPPPQGALEVGKLASQISSDSFKGVQFSDHAPSGI